MGRVPPADPDPPFPGGGGAEAPLHCGANAPLLIDRGRAAVSLPATAELREIIGFVIPRMIRVASDMPHP